MTSNVNLLNLEKVSSTYCIRNCSLIIKNLSGPKDKTDIKSIKDYFRMDTMLALKILLLQRKYPKRFQAIMEMESNEKNRLLTSNYK